MKLHTDKLVLISSGVIGLIVSLSYILILVINGFEINESNLFMLAMLPELIFKIFLFFASISLLLSSTILLFTKRRAKYSVVYIAIGASVSSFTCASELWKIRSSNLYKSTEDMSLKPPQVIELYKTALNRQDIRSLSNIAIHPNLPDSIQEHLSNSNIMAVRRKIAWKTDSEEIIRKLSSDSEFEVRMAVAINKFTPLEIIHDMQNDPDEYVRNTAFSMYQVRK